MNRSMRRCSGLLLALATCVAAASTTPKSEEGKRSAATEAIMDVTWEWTGTRTPRGIIEVSAPEHYTIRLKHNGEAQIRFDCNHGGSLYEIADGSLSFGTMTYTRIKCGAESQGISYRQQLGAVIAFSTKQGNLYLELLQESGTMRFRRAGGN